METELEVLLPLTNECYINRVPEKLRQSNEHFYTPKVVSIGPIHCRKEELRATEEYKKRYLKHFLRLGEASLKDSLKLVQRNETKLRNCYADPTELDSNDFVKLVLLDAVFLLMRFFDGPLRTDDASTGRKRIFQVPTLLLGVDYDLVLLENQLPFFIIEELYNLSNIFNKQQLSRFQFCFPHKDAEPFDFVEETARITLAIVFLDRLGIMDIPNRDPPTEVEHLLALLRFCLKPKYWDPDRKPITSASIPTSKELNQAGVKFKAGKNKNLYEIGFKNGVLEIPYVIVHNYTELVFRNLAAFELCNGPDLLCLDYFRMMQKFTTDPADAEVLIRNKIIRNDLPDAQAVSTLFHSLSPAFVEDCASFGYSDVVHDLNAYYARTWNRWKATWIQKYFKAPWAFCSFLAAVILLLLTVAQTVCSILQVT